MRIPGVAGVVAGLTGGAVGVVRAGVSTAAGAVGAVQMLTSPVTELAGPVMQSMAQTTGRAIGFGGDTSAVDVVDDVIDGRGRARVDRPRHVEGGAAAEARPDECGEQGGCRSASRHGAMRFRRKATMSASSSGETEWSSPG